MIITFVFLWSCSDKKQWEMNQKEKETKTFDEVSWGGGNGVPTSQSNSR